MNLVPKTKFNKMVAAVLASVLVLAGIYLVFTSEASPIVIGGTAYGPYPATVVSDYPSAANIYFNTKFSSLSQVCLNLDMDPVYGGEGLAYGEKGLLTVPGGGPGTKFGNDQPGTYQTRGSVCITDKADLAQFLDGSHQVRFQMNPGGSMKVNRLSAYTIRGL